MIHILVKLTVKNFTALEEFECQAVAIMNRHGGQLLSAFETCRNEDGSGEEVHVLAFPSDEAFARYRADGDLASLKDLRERAVIHTEVLVSERLKNY